MQVVCLFDGWEIYFIWEFSKHLRDTMREEKCITRKNATQKKRTKVGKFIWKYFSRVVCKLNICTPEN